MNIAEKHTYNLEGILQHMPPGADSMKSSATSGVVSEKRLSRVSVLRDMFQNGIVHPIDDIDERGCNNECSSREDPLRFLRTFPGSPPLSALRNHRSSGVNCATHGSSHDSTNSTKPSLLALKPVASRTKSPSNHSPIPPIRPPKPRFLSLGKTLGVKSVIIPVKPASSPVRSEMEVSSNDNPIVGLPGSPVTNGDNAHSALVGVTSLTRPALTASVVEVRESVTKTVTNSASDEKSAQPCSTVRSVGSTNSEGSRTSNERGNDGKNGMTPLPRSIPPTTKAPELTGGNTSADSEVTSVRVQTSPILSDQKATPELADSLLTEPGILQHAEPIAVATPDNDEESEDEVDEHRSDDELVPTFSAEPTLPVPPGLKVVAVDLLGVHILEDGNFFYSVPGLPEDVSSILDNTDILNVTQTARIKHSESGEDIVDGTQLSEEGNVNKISGCLDDLSALTDSDTSLSRKTHVRFSTEPIMVFSTHSTTEYNRRNEDIDPLAASAEYELEKHLEEMELFNVDLKKGPQGLGISILGLGVDNVGGDQKLGIFIKSLTPGGAAEANGNIEVFDQVVEVDGTSLVGVSQQFAAQTLRNTHDIVHFVLAREKDPANSRVAQLLAEQQDEERMQTCSYNNSGSYSADNVPTDSLSRDDSLETLHKLMAEAAETAARSNAESLSDNELGDVSLSDAPSHADRGGNNDGTEFGSNPMFSPDSVEIDDEHPADRLIHPEISPAPSSSEKCGTEKVGPRSALKGTATAASTKRRQEAIVNLIHLARQRTKLASSRQEKQAPKTNAETDDSGTNEVVWVLANELYDSNNQLSKLASQLRTTEQLLTAQEAAADEAIERLCRQCRHVEMELNQAREQIKSLLRTQCDGQTLGTDCSLRAPPDTASFQSNGVDGALNDHLDVQSTGLNTPVNVIPGNISSDNGEGQSQPPVVDLRSPLSVSIWSSQYPGCVPSALHTYRPLCLDQQDKDQICGWPEQLFHDCTNQPNLNLNTLISEHRPGGASVELNSVRAHISEDDDPQTDAALPAHVKRSLDRLRLVSSGGLAHRHPRTLLSINPPPFLYPDNEANLDAFIPISLQNSKSLSGNNGCLGLGHATNCRPSAAMNLPLRPLSSSSPHQFSQSQWVDVSISHGRPPVCSEIARSGSCTQSNGDQNYTYHKVMGVQLLGLAEAAHQSTALRHPHQLASGGSDTPKQPTAGSSHSEVHSKKQNPVTTSFLYQPECRKEGSQKLTSTS